MNNEHDPPRSQALEEPAPVVNQNLTATMAHVDLVERLSESSWNASAPGMWRFIPEYRKDVHRAHVRAILAELAAMGEEALDEEAIAKQMLAECGMHTPVPAWDELAPASAAMFLDMARAARNVVAPILAAKYAERAEQARELARVGGLLEDYKLMATSGDPRVARARDAALLKCNIERDTLRHERDAATKEAEALRAKVAELEARARILEIAPRAAHYANQKLGVAPGSEDATSAADTIVDGAAYSPWHAAVLEYAAKARAS